MYGLDDRFLLMKASIDAKKEEDDEKMNSFRDFFLYTW